LTEKSLAIIGSGPTGIYTLQAVVEAGDPLNVTVFEKSDCAGVGMPYADDANTKLMLANIASIEIPPIGMTYLDWLKLHPDVELEKHGVAKPHLHDRKFLPRILLGQYFRDQFLWLVDQAKEAGFEIQIRESTEVTDVEACDDSVRIWVNDDPEPLRFDWAVLATGHVWPDADEATRSYFPSPWSGLVDAPVPAVRVGIMGTSLSAIDAAMAVVAQHGSFVENDGRTTSFALDRGSDALSVTLMSRSCLLPEADFYCPIPYEPLAHCTPEALLSLADAGSDGLLDRAFELFAREIADADAAWAARIGLDDLNCETFEDAYFADRLRHDPFRWAEYNLAETEANKRNRVTVAWRYAILRMHEPFQEIIPHLTDGDRERFDNSLSRVFMDNYAAIPAESIRRLLALRDAGVLRLLELGDDYEKLVKADTTVLIIGEKQHEFDVFIDARGQRAMTSEDLPFEHLRRQLLEVGQDIPEVLDDYSLSAPDAARGRIALGALPYLIHDQPFVQGITASAEIGSKVATMMRGVKNRHRKRLFLRPAHSW